MTPRSLSVRLVASHRSPGRCLRHTIAHGSALETDPKQGPPVPSHRYTCPLRCKSERTARETVQMHRRSLLGHCDPELCRHDSIGSVNIGSGQFSLVRRSLVRCASVRCKSLWIGSGSDRRNLSCGGAGRFGSVRRESVRFEMDRSESSRRGVGCFSVERCGSRWRSTTRSGSVWRGYGSARLGMTRCDVVGLGAARCGSPWVAVSRRGSVRFGSVRCDVDRIGSV